MSKIGNYAVEMQEMVSTRECAQCNGAGEVEVDYPMPHSSSRDVGYIETRLEACDMCAGSGEVALEDEYE